MEIERFKLKTQSSALLKNPYNFVKYYTCGPEQPMDVINLAEIESKCPPKILKYVILIQRRYRSHLFLRRLKQKMEENRQEREFIYR